eukprot:CAMPEP_0195020082 /NCGR_PEP_ID=MMETSP0326_2-20130528/34359_1 /TAXON_ID=2866 ORGANISM="Crypthecodinium cohnii, Strain Seligo" /NCGR_SAMPLE_ID=MMETSP0326_2 /ASSEMBLY_ACC=CAM_ASM_000348 /LENGTH=41 /DNA_ID= /DNA_START= /DNA_END= /DNA_ORIENTATION=
MVLPTDNSEGSPKLGVGAVVALFSCAAVDVVAAVAVAVAAV